MSLFTALRDGYYNRNSHSRKARRKRGPGSPGTRRPVRRPNASLMELLEERTLLSAIVTTDQPDYAPGSTAYFTATNDLSIGTNFQPGETIQFHIDRTDGGTVQAPPAVQDWEVTDGVGGFTPYQDATGMWWFPDLDGQANGTVDTSWAVDSQFAGASLQVTATGLTSGAVAQTDFTDAGRTWLGVDTNWNNTANWSGATLPTLSDDVTIPAGLTNYPVINAAANAKSITLQTGIGTQPSLTVSAITLTVAQDITINAGTFTVNGGTVTETAGALSGAGTVSLSGAGTLAVNDFATTGTNNVSGGTLKIGHDFKPSTFVATGGLVEWTGAGTNASFKPANTTAYSGSPTGTVANNTTTTLTLSAPSTIQNGDVILFNGNEDMLVLAGAGTTTLTVVRDYAGTTPNNNSNNVLANKTVLKVIPDQFWDVQMDSGATVGSGNSSNVIAVAHNWTNNSSALVLSQLGVIFDGSGAQVINGSQDSKFSDVAINNSAGITPGVSFASATANQTFNASLTFLSGKLTTGSNVAIIPSTGNVVSAGGTTGFVQGDCIIKSYPSSTFSR